MEMLTADNNLDEEYEEWFLKKEAYEKLLKQIWNEYLHVFGKLLIKHFQWESACKYMKKKILYKGKYSKEETEKIIRIEMEDDFINWNQLNEESEIAKYSLSVTPFQLEQIDFYFSSIFRILQPDFHTEEEIQSIWKKAQKAYICNDEEALKKMKEDLKEFKIENIYTNKELIKRTECLKNEVKNIKESEVFAYKKILEDPQLILKKEKELVDNINGDKYYFQHLKMKAKQMIING